jgi:RNA polymerase sigma factor (sigma-70 family)
MPASMDHVIDFLRRNAVPGAGERDGELLRRFVAAGEATAFAVLVRRHGPMVLGVCRRLLGNVHDAEDAFQATFLVLARKARSVRKPDALAHWLYGVAYRVALKARKLAPRRPVMNPIPEEVSSSDPVAEAAGHELRPVIDEELNRLPEKYRAPLVLCYLEGKTNEEAARLLGWTKGTVSGRLARARDLLRPRLARRGVGLSAGLAVLLTRSETPAALAETTVRAALAGGASAPAAALAQGVIRAMFVSQIKTWTAVVALALAAAGGGYWWQSAPAAGADEKVRRAPPGAGEERPAKERPGVIFTVPDELKVDSLDLKRLQGNWRALSLEYNGVQLAPEAARKFRVVIRNDTITFNPDGAKRVATFKLDPSRRPNVIWLTPEGAEKTPPVHGIYDSDEGRLKLCFDNDEGKAVPTDFATKPGSGLTLIVLTREADDWKVVEDKRPDRAFRTFTGSGAPVTAVAFSPDGRGVAACAEDGSVYSWEAATGKIRYKLVGDDYIWRSVAFSRDSKLLAVAGSRTIKKKIVDGLVNVADAATGKLVMEIKEEDEGTTAVAISPDGKHLASAGGDGAIRLYALPRGERLFVSHGHKGAVNSVAFSPDGRWILTGGADRATNVWDVETGKQLRSIIGNAGDVTVVKFSPDGRWILTGGQDGSARLWDAASGKEVVRLQVHRKGVLSADFSPDGKLLATAGADGEVRIWEAATGKEVATVEVDKKEIRGVAFSPDGNALVTGGADGMVRLWAVGR